MGIKGKRRRERLKQQKDAQAQLDAMEAAGMIPSDIDDEDGVGGMEEYFPGDEYGNMMLAPGEELPPGVGPAAMGGEFGLPGGPKVPKMKRSEMANLQDLDYLERVRGEHKERHTSHLRKKKKEVDVEENAAMAEEELGEVADATDLDALLNPTQATRKRVAIDTGAKFSHPLLDLNEYLVEGLRASGFKRMTAIQQRAIPLAISGSDILGQAKTGSGKTLAFSIPVLNATIRQVATNSTLFVALMVAPTKELCVQTNNIINNILENLPPAAGAGKFKSLLITGGTKVLEERKQLAQANIVVGTPGRVLDHIRHSQATWKYKTTQFLVLDEADRMLADGFARDLDAIVAAMPKNRQTFLFSATNSKSVHELARLSLAKTPLFISSKGTAPNYIDTEKNPIPPPPYVDLSGDASSDEEEDEEDYHSDEDGEYEDGNSGVKRKRKAEDVEDIPSALRQFCAIVPVADRLRALYVFVKRVARTAKTMVFCSTVASAIYHCQMMGSVGFHEEVLMLHGHMKHRQRLATFECFQKWDSGVIFCTDVAARGLDIPNVDWILQFDPPLDPTEYVHRIGRTARAGSVGSALIFISPEEASFVPYLAKFGMNMEKYPMPDRLPDIQLKLEHVLQVDSVVAKSAIAAFRAYVGAYQSHVLKETFNVQNLDLQDVATGFALHEAPKVTLPKNSAEEKEQDYIKGKLKSLNKQKRNAQKHYHDEKTKIQWTKEGQFVGVHKPLMR